MQINNQQRHAAKERTDQQIAVIFANSLPWSGWFEPTLARVGTLPVVLRAILGVQSCKPDRIIVILNRVIGPQIWAELTETRRVPGNVEWLETDPNASLSSILRDVIGESDRRARLLLVAGDRTYQPSLHRLVSEWDGQSKTLELATGSAPAGLFALRYEAALELASDTESNVFNVRDLHRWITQQTVSQGSSFVDFRLVDEGTWQHVSMPQDVLIAEQKLDRWLVKPTDGVFARMNRRISIPISRQLIKLPITPNMVSLFTLGVSFAAGSFYALGGYWNTLFGAVLSVGASILDGCDGEVARLKFQSSDFGCWLETACDYLYYFFIFAGMTIGLARSSGNHGYWLWGTGLLFGAAATILIAWFERSRLSGKHPEQFLSVWQKNAESRSSNPLLYIGRHCEFIIRRCFLPYALLFFALLNLNWLALYMTAFGANVAWIISLYSKLSFSSRSAARTQASTSAERKPAVA